MVELGTSVSEGMRELVEFVRSTGGGVIATNSGTGHPESAYVKIAATDQGRIVFGTNALSRKFDNISSDPRVSMVMLQQATRQIQLEGEAEVLEGSAVPAAVEVLAAQHPDDPAPGDPENARVLEITVRWARLTDAGEATPVVRELELR